MKHLVPWLAASLGLASLMVVEEPRTLPAIRPYAGPLNAKADKPRFEKLQDYYFEANPVLRQRLDEVKKAWQDGKGYGYTFVCAPGGAGKSFLFGSFSKSLAEHLYAIDLTKMDKEKMFMRRVVELAPLNGEDATRSTKMRAFGRANDSPNEQRCPPLPELFGIIGHDLTKKPRPFLMIDSLDEVHPRSSLSVLERVEDHLKQVEQRTPGGFQHVFVFGRPESFKEFYRDTPQRKPTLFAMKLPNYRSLTDLKIGLESSRVYHDRKEKDVEATLELTAKHPFLQESVHFLNIQGDLLKAAQEMLNRRDDERAIKDALLGKILERNADVMFRPTLTSAWYARLLQAIAAKHLNVDDDGWFTIGRDDAIELADGQKRTFQISTVLDRSGLIVLDEKDFRKPRYRFVPSWVHEHLVWRHQQQQKP